MTRVPIGGGYPLIMAIEQSTNVLYVFFSGDNRMFGLDIAMLEKGVVLNLAETFLKLETENVQMVIPWHWWACICICRVQVHPLIMPLIFHFLVKIIQSWV
jgi:hypothetical protein